MEFAALQVQVTALQTLLAAVISLNYPGLTLKLKLNRSKEITSPRGLAQPLVLEVD